MSEQTSTQVKDVTAEPLRFRAIGAASLVLLAALAVTGDPERRWPATAGVLVLWAIGAGIVAWRGRRQDRAETRATRAIEFLAIAALFGAFTLAMWSHDAVQPPPLSGIHPL